MVTVYTGSLCAGCNVTGYNGDGTFTSKSQYKKMDSLEGLTYRFAQAEDYEYFGPFAIYG